MYWACKACTGLLQPWSPVHSVKSRMKVTRTLLCLPSPDCFAAAYTYGIMCIISVCMCTRCARATMVSMCPPCHIFVCTTLGFHGH